MSDPTPSNSGGLSADTREMLKKTGADQAAYEQRRVEELGGKPGEPYYKVLIEAISDQHEAYEKARTAQLGYPGLPYVQAMLARSTYEAALDEANVCKTVSTQVAKGTPQEEAYANALAQIGWDRSNVLACAPAGWAEQFQHGVAETKPATAPTKDTTLPR